MQEDTVLLYINTYYKAIATRVEPVGPELEAEEVYMKEAASSYPGLYSYG